MLNISTAGLRVAVTTLIALLFVSAVLTHRNTVGRQADAQQVEHSHELIRAINDVRESVKDAETGERGYLITGDERYLVPYRAGLETIDEKLGHLSQLIGDDAAQRSRFGSLELGIRELLQHLGEVVAVRTHAGFEAARELEFAGRGKTLMDAMRLRIDAMLEAEETLLRERITEAADNYRTALLGGQLAGGALIILFLVTLVLARRNVSALSRAARELEEHHELLRTTLASIVEGIIVVDVEDRVTHLNPVAELMTGSTLEQAIGRPIAAIYQPLDERARALARGNSRPAQAGAPAQIGTRRTTVFGSGESARTIDENTMLLYDLNGAITGLVLALRDVTEQRYAEKEVADARAYAESIVDTIPDPLVILDRELRIRSANLSYYEKYATSEELTLGRRLTEVDSGRWNEPAVLRLLRELTQGGERDHVVEVEQELPRLGTRNLVLLARNLRGEGEQLDLILLAVQDETETRGNERRIQQLLQDAEENASRLREIAAASLALNSAHSRERVLGVLREEACRILEVDDAVVTLAPATVRAKSQQLAAELTGRDGQVLGTISLQAAARRVGRQGDNDEMILRQLATVASVAVENSRLYEELRAGDRRKDEFLATLAHELRNPLAPVRNSVEVLRASWIGSEERERALSTIERQVSLLVRLVDDLLDVSRITRGKILLKRERVELAEVVGQALEISRPIIHASGNTLVVQLPTEPVALFVDPARLAQVLCNLLHNAAKYTERGGTIALECRVEGEELLISVRDDGIGIPPEMLPHIFEMFWQLEHALERAQGGLGIGLSLVRQLVEMHGGRVEARSPGVGAGSEFIVHLHLRPADGQAGSVAPAAPTAVPEEGAALAAQRILVVDDNLDSAESLAMLLRLQGHDVRTAHDGAAAVEAARGFLPALIMLDIGLPRMNGYEAARAIRELGLGEVKIVAMTGWGQEEDRRRSREAGFDDHLVKPVNLVQLRRIVAGLDEPPS